MVLRTCGFWRNANRETKREHNTADIGTKAVIEPVLMNILKIWMVEWRDGRHPLALSAALVLLRLEQSSESL